MAKKKIDNKIFKTLIEDYNIKDTNDIKNMLKEWATEISRTISIIFMELMFRHLWSVKLQIKLYLKLGNGSLDSLRMYIQ